MTATRRRHGAELEAMVTMEAIRGDLTLAEWAVEHGLLHTMIGARKRQGTDGGRPVG